MSVARCPFCYGGVRCVNCGGTNWVYTSPAIVPGSPEVVVPIDTFRVTATGDTRITATGDTRTTGGI